LWQWFLDYGIYIIITLSAGIVLVFLTTRLSKTISKRILLKDLPESLKNAQGILTTIIALMCSSKRCLI
jgi:hypothetical protein